MRIGARLLLAISLAICLGCAKQDWIDRTLVTVDVTGAWSGELLSRGGAGGMAQRSTVSLTLDQKGSRVTGAFEVVATEFALFSSLGARRSGGVEGTVAGGALMISVSNGVLEVCRCVCDE